VSKVEVVIGVNCLLGVCQWKLCGIVEITMNKLGLVTPFLARSRCRLSLFEVVWD
jgi:hypothetical protein